MEKFKQDLRRKELIPIKILMFLIYGGQATLYPYFTVHLKSLGVSIRQTSIIFAVQPIIALLVAPAIGMVADKIGNFKIIFSFFLIFSAITANLLLLVPPISPTEKLLHFNLNCDSNADLTISLNEDLSCNINNEVNDTFSNITVKIQCEYSCETQNNLFFPIFIKEDKKDCSKSCSEKDVHECSNINDDTEFDLFIKTRDLLTSNVTKFTEESYMISYNNNTYSTMECSCKRCNASCSMVSQDSVSQCLDPPLPEEFGVTFWSYLGIRLVITLGIGLVNGLFDAASMTVIQDLKADVGFQRFWSTVGMCLLAPISGYFVDSINNYRPCFFMYGALYLIAAITSLKLDLSMKLPSDNPIKNLTILLKNPELILLLLHILVLGISWGFLENFLFWFLESELDSNNLIMGLTVTVGSGTGLFMALVSTWCTKKLGYVNVIIVAFMAYTVRFFGYSYSTDAYTCLIFEMMENFTVTLLTVGVTLYCTELASLESLTTVMTLWNGLHIISGRAFGSLLGGFLVKHYGFRPTFRIFAYISIFFGCFYALIYVLWLRKWRANHRKESGDIKKRNSIFSEDKEEEAMKNEAFSSLSMHCSFDSPTILHYVPDSPSFEFRRRAMSHIPVTRSNSLRQAGRLPRYASSFSEGLPHQLSITKDKFQDCEDSRNVDTPTTFAETIYRGEEGVAVTKF